MFGRVFDASLTDERSCRIAAMIPPPAQVLPKPPERNSPPPPLWSGRMQLALAFILGVLALLLIQYAVGRFRPGRPTEPLDNVVYIVDLNRAQRGELMQLPNLGEVLVDRILDYRHQHGGFRSVDELDRVQGIGPLKLETLRPRVKVQSATLPENRSVISSPTRRIDLNEAGKEELVSLPGIGPVLAERILADRAKNGPFRSVEDLMRVSGIKHKMLEKVRAHVRVGRETLAGTTSPATP